MKSLPKLTRENLRGTWGTLLLPIREDESIDYEALGVEIQTLIASGVAGIYSNGSAGEFYAQSDAEYLKINTQLAEACHAAGLPFQIGACHPCAQESLERIRAARHLEPSAFQVILPDWFPVNPAEAIAFLEKVIQEAGNAGVVLYNPPHAKRRLSPAEFGTLTTRFPRLLGVKVPGGDESWYAAMREHCKGLSIFIPGHFLATGLAQGAHGAYSNVACIHPGAAVAWNRLIETSPNDGREVEKEIQAFLQLHIAPYLERGYTNSAADKLLAAIGGWAPVGTRLRWPYQGVSEEDVPRLRELAQKELTRFFALASAPADNGK